MKMSVQATPNQHLRRERERRGWSRQYVAEQIGSDFNMIGRWERGNIFPSPYYRQKLCELFDKSAQDLGLMQESPNNRSEGTATHTGENQNIAASLPEVPRPLWHVPYRRNPFFTGREDVLLHLYNRMHVGTDIVVSSAHAISGLGGIGKTQTAIEYAYRYRDEYQDVLWVRADTRETLIADFMSITSLLNLPEKNEQDQSRIVKALKHWLNSRTNWLLILDNVEDFDMVADFLPSSSKGHILLTTRAQSTGTIAQCINLEEMEPEEGALFLLRRAKLVGQDIHREHIFTTDYRKAREISQVMGGLPLALGQAGAYIEETSCSLSDYLERYQTRRTNLLNMHLGLVADHPESVTATFSLSFEKVQQASPVAAELLRLCAFLHPDAIPEEIITKGASDLGPILQTVATDPCELDLAIAVLRKFSLLRRNPDTKTLTIHRLVQAVLKDGMDQDSQLQWAERAVRAVNRAFPTVEGTPLHCCQRYLPHAQACAVLIEDWKMMFPEAAELLYRLGDYLRNRSQFAQAKPLFQQLLVIREQILGPNHPAIAENFNDLGVLYYHQGKYAQAELLFQQALAMREQILEPNHPAITESLNDLGVLYYHQGKYAQAELLFQQALLIREQMLDPDHPAIIESLNNLASLYRKEGKYTCAEAMYLRALSIEERRIEKDYPMLAICLNNLGKLYLLQGKYAQAESLFQQALTIFEQVEGPEHPDVALGLSNLAELYSIEGRYTQAESLYQRALLIREKVLGPEHRRVAETLNALAELYYKQDVYKQDMDKYIHIEMLFQRALAIYERTLGPEHPDFIKVQKNYVVLLLAMKRKAEARELKARIKEIQAEKMRRNNRLEKEQLYA